MSKSKNPFDKVKEKFEKTPEVAKDLVVATVGGPGAAVIDKTAQHVTGERLSTQVLDAASNIHKYNPYAKTDVGPAPDVTKPREIDMKGLVNPNAAAPTVDGTSAFRDSQLGLVSHLQDQVAGRGPSLAALQAQESIGQATKQAFAMANSGRGGANPGAQRAAMMQAGEMQGQAASIGAQARLQEQMQAAGLLGQVSAQGRQVDAALAVERAKQDQAHRELAAKYSQMGLDAQKAMVLADLEVGKMVQTGALGVQKLQFDAAQKQKDQVAGLINKVGGAAVSGGTSGLLDGGGGVDGEVDNSMDEGEGDLQYPDQRGNGISPRAS